MTTWILLIWFVAGSPPSRERYSTESACVYAAEEAQAQARERSRASVQTLCVPAERIFGTAPRGRQ